MAKKTGVKKAKASKVKAKKVAKKVKAKKVKPTPTYMTGDKPLRIGLHDVIKALRVIEKYGHTRKFVAAAKKENAIVLIDPPTVNFVKDFVVKYDMYNDPVGKHIVNAQEASPEGTLEAAGAKDPFECDFSKH